MLGICQNLMMGVITAQSNIELARQNQGLANQRYLAERIRVSQGARDNNQDMIEEGKQLKAEGEEMALGTFEHLSNAMYNINNIDAANQTDSSDESEESCDESSRETQFVDYEQTDSGSDAGFNVVVRGDTIRGSVNRTVSTPRQSRINISV